MTDRSAAPNSHSATQEPPRRRRGCSCTTVILYLLFLFIILLFGAWMLAQWYARKFITDGLTPTEVVEFEKWLDEPLNLPSEFTKIHPADTEELTDLKKEAHQVLDDLDDDFREYSTAFTETTTQSLSAADLAQLQTSRSDGAFEDMMLMGFDPMMMPPDMMTEETEEIRRDKLLLAEKVRLQLALTPEEETSHSLMLQKAEKAMNRMSEIVSHPDYTGNTRGLMPEKNLSYYSDRMIDAARLFRTSDRTSATQAALRTALRYEHCDPEFAMITQRLNNRFFSEIRSGSDQTSDPQTLRAYLDLLSDYEKAAAVRGADSYVVDARILRLPALWREFVPNARMPVTRRDYLDFELALDSIMKPIWNKMPPGDPRSKEITPDKFDSLVSLIPLQHHSGMAGSITGNRYSDNMLISLGKPVIRLGMRTYVYYTQAQQFPHIETSLVEPYHNALARARVVTAHVASRLATAQGQPAATAMDALVPGILAAPLIDPFNNQPLSYSEEKQQFFSVGPDKIPGTADDIFIESNVEAESGMDYFSLFF